jgi:hypothetical protein
MAAGDTMATAGRFILPCIGQQPPDSCDAVDETPHGGPGTEILGAKLGAIHDGHRWTPVDPGRLESPSFRPGWTAVDAHGHGLEIYGSGRWGFESLRAC